MIIPSFNDKQSDILIRIFLILGSGLVVGLFYGGRLEAAAAWVALWAVWYGVEAYVTTQAILQAMIEIAQEENEGLDVS